MNKQPYQTPPRRWSPRLSPRWMRFWRPYRQRIARNEHKLEDVKVLGHQHLTAAIKRPGGVLITPNHPAHADPFVLLEVADQLETPMFFMTAWQVFHNTHHVGRRVLRQHGCFSINREGHDVGGVRQAIRILEAGETPLVIFPEGEVFHLNDRVVPFRRGAVHSAVLAAERSGKPVSVVPCGIKYQFVEDPSPELHQRMDRLEGHIGVHSLTGTPLVTRILHAKRALLADYESRLFGSAQHGSIQRRIDNAIEAVLVPLERQFRTNSKSYTVPERVKRLRHHIILRIEQLPADSPGNDREELNRALRQLFNVMQAFSYPVDYLTSNPSVERLAETIEKLEEDVLGIQRSVAPGNRRAVVAFDRPMVIRPTAARRQSIGMRTRQLQQRVQNLIDRMSSIEVLPELLVAGDDGASVLAA